MKKIIKNKMHLILIFYSILIFLSVSFTFFYRDSDITLKDYLENAYYVSQLAIIFIIFLAYKAIKSDHEARRREKFIEIMQTYNNTSNDGMMFVARKLMKNFSPMDKKRIFNIDTDNSKPIKINDDIIFLIKSYCCDKIKCNCACDGACCNKIITFDKKLTKEATLLIRQCIVSYINKIESLCSAYTNSVVDKKMFKEEYSYLADESENYIAMISDFGTSDGCPCTINFIKELQEHAKKNRELANE